MSQLEEEWKWILLEAKNEKRKESVIRSSFVYKTLRFRPCIQYTNMNEEEEFEESTHKSDGEDSYHIIVLLPESKLRTSNIGFFHGRSMEDKGWNGHRRIRSTKVIESIQNHFDKHGNRTRKSSSIRNTKMNLLDVECRDHFQ